MAQKVIKDKFGAILEIGDEVVYTYQQEFRKGKIVKFTHAGNVVIDSWPRWMRDPVTGSYRNYPVIKSLGRYKECAKLNPTYLVDRPKVEIKQTER